MTDTPQHTLDADGDGDPDFSTDAAADARQRAVRTLAQGALVAGLLAVCTVLVTVLTSASGWDAVDWRALSWLLVQAAGTAVASYIGRHVAPPA